MSILTKLLFKFATFSCIYLTLARVAMSWSTSKICIGWQILHTGYGRYPAPSLSVESVSRHGCRHYRGSVMMGSCSRYLFGLSHRTIPFWWTTIMTSCWVATGLLSGVQLVVRVCRNFGTTVVLRGEQSWCYNLQFHPLIHCHF
ncbi:hypothetical protein EDD22DRAFT_993213 [Suillus occidentalis]|nr:hypothetical protein EDD22DRAFT_993213 [Suillus occidentalis]